MKSSTLKVKGKISKAHAYRAFVLSEKLKKILTEFNRDVEQYKQEFLDAVKKAQLKERKSIEEASRKSEKADEMLEKELKKTSRKK